MPSLSRMCSTWVSTVLTLRCRVLGDPEVGAALGHQLEHLVLARRQRVDEPRPTGRAEQQGDHVGVDDGAAADDGADGGDEGLPVGDPLLEQVAGRSAGRERPHGQGRAGVHGQEQHARSSAPSARSSSSARIPSSLWSGGIRMSRTTASASGCACQGRVQPGDVGRPTATTSQPPAVSSCRTPSRTRTASSTTMTRGRSRLTARAPTGRWRRRSCPRDRTRRRGARRAPRPGRPGPAARCPEPSSRAPPWPSSVTRHAHGVAERHLDGGAGAASACLATLVRHSAATKYAVAAVPRPARPSPVTRTRRGDRRAQRQLAQGVLEACRAPGRSGRSRWRGCAARPARG